MNEEKNLNGHIKNLIEKAKSLGVPDSDIKDCNNQESCLKNLIYKKEQEWEKLIKKANKPKEEQKL